MAEYGTHCRGQQPPHELGGLCNPTLCCCFQQTRLGGAGPCISGSHGTSHQPQPCPASACPSLVTRELKALSMLCRLQFGELPPLIAVLRQDLLPNNTHPLPTPPAPASATLPCFGGWRSDSLCRAQRHQYFRAPNAVSPRTLSAALCESLLLDESLAGTPGRRLLGPG